MCGVVGLYSKSPVTQVIFDSLTALQHRGQDAAGIMTSESNGKIHEVKGPGLIRDVVRQRHMLRLVGNMGIGHVRYPTAGTDADNEAQPFYVNSPYGLGLVHNGNLTNVEQLKQDVTHINLRHLNTSSDSEVLLNVIAYELQHQHTETLTAEVVFLAMKNVFKRLKGAFAVVVMVAGVGLIAMRDPMGIRPLSLGRKTVDGKEEFMVASESVALDLSGYKEITDVAPGEAIFINEEGVARKQCASVSQLSPCIFEYVYLARPDSMIDGISVYKVRLRLGELLAKTIKQQWSHHTIDVVMPIPDTSRTAASVLARRLGVKFREGFVKNRYIGRTFIMPGQQLRKKSVRQKLNTIPLEFQDKNVLLVDDSIVRGTTSQEIIAMAREAGAKNVFFASAAPEVRFPNVYGIDMPAANELIANSRTNDEIKDIIGADNLIFLSFDDLLTACREGNMSIVRFEDSIFTGEYITQDIDESYLAKVKSSRGEKPQCNSVIDNT